MSNKLYKDEEWAEYMVDVCHPFHDDEETFEVYECEECGGHFLVESHGVESVSILYCPYCKSEFI